MPKGFINNTSATCGTFQTNSICIPVIARGGGFVNSTTPLNLQAEEALREASQALAKANALSGQLANGVASVLASLNATYFTNASNLAAGTVPAAQMPALTGDVTSPAGSLTTTLTGVNSNVGTFGSATSSPIITVDAKGRLTAVSTAVIAPAWTSLTSRPTTVGGFGITDAITTAGGQTINGTLTIAGNVAVQANVSTNADIVHDIGQSGARFRNIYAQTFQGTATSAYYADVAERFAASEPLAPGDVVELGGGEEIRKARGAATTDVLGVISTNPAFCMNSGAGDDLTHPFVAFAGRVPCRVVGPITKGQRLMNSEIDGVAMAAPASTAVQAIIGRALQDKTTDDVGLVMVVVGLG